MVLNMLLFLQWKACSTPHEPEVSDSLIVREAFEHLPEPLDNLVLHRAVAVSRNLLESFNTNFVQAHDSVLKELPTDNSEEVPVERLLNSFNKGCNLNLGFVKAHLESLCAVRFYLIFGQWNGFTFGNKINCFIIR